MLSPSVRFTSTVVCCGGVQDAAVAGAATVVRDELWRRGDAAREGEEDRGICLY